MGRVGGRGGRQSILGNIQNNQDIESYLNVFFGKQILNVTWDFRAISMSEISQYSAEIQSWPQK